MSMKRSLRNAASKVYRSFGVQRFRGLVGGLFDRREPLYDLVVVVSPGYRGWIIEGIANEIARHFPGKCCIHYSLTSLPAAKAYFFAHYMMLVGAYRYNPVMWRKKVFAWYTHPHLDLDPDSERQFFYVLNELGLIFCASQLSADYLHSKGVPAARTASVLGGADPALFLPHSRGSGKIGFCSAYYERKAPEKIVEIVKRMPHRAFLLVGRRWDRYERFAELRALPNFEYVDADYADYPALYAQMDVFVSTSTLEGGPIPLIEAMMCNAVPVASRTGFAPEVIRHGENGFLFETDAAVDVICGLIEQAATLEGDIRATVLHCSWRAFSAQVAALMGFGARGSRP